MSLTSSGCFKIRTTATGNDTEYKAKSLKPEWESLASEDSGRSDDGVMHIEWIKTQIPKIAIEMPPMSASDAHALLSKVQGKIYWITYYDIERGAEHRAHVYTSTSSGDCYNGVLMTNGLWQGIAFNAIGLGDDSDD